MWYRQIIKIDPARNLGKDSTADIIDAVGENLWGFAMDEYADQDSNIAPESWELSFGHAMLKFFYYENWQKIKAASYVIPKTTSSGKLDFHACRVAFISYILEAGATVKKTQVLARHSTPALPLNTYACTKDSRLTDLTEMVDEKLLFQSTSPAFW